MPITADETRAVLARWQPILRLADWDIDLRLVTGAWRKSGDVKVDLDDRKAVLLLNAEPRSENLEETIVHELVHARLYALDQMLVELLDAVFGADADEPRRAFAETRFMTLLESTTEDLAKALLVASGSPAPLSFGRLREEVEREIGPGTTANQACTCGDRRRRRPSTLLPHSARRPASGASRRRFSLTPSRWPSWSRPLSSISSARWGSTRGRSSRSRTRQ